MTRNEMDVELVRRICCGNQSAMDFLANYWAKYCHLIDDLIDGDAKGAEATLRAFALAITIYSHPFYLQNLAALRQVALNVTCLYADTVAWENAGDWRGTWADMNRHCSIEMVVAVATICGGYEHARCVIPELRMLAYAEHHREGKAV
jgi:hypothetical protein